MSAKDWSASYENHLLLSCTLGQRQKLLKLSFIFLIKNGQKNKNLSFCELVFHLQPIDCAGCYVMP